MRAFHARLLVPTLRNALRTPFYQSLWAERDISAVTVEKLNTLPMVDKECIRQAGTDAQIRAGLVCNEIFTSGTTGVPLVTVRGNREQEFIRDFYCEIHRREQQGPLLRGLQINNPYHGYHVSVPSPVHFHRIGIYDSGSFEYGRKVLLSEHHDEGIESRCTILLGLERCLRAFTQDTMTRYPEGLRTYLICVVSYSQYLTCKWRSLMEKTWGCRVIDRYSLTEIFGSATQCMHCGWWHFDPFVIPEVVAVNSGNPVHEGEGLLVLTALYPFQESQPMVRYSTGDLVSVTCTRSCQPWTLAIRPLGRARYGVQRPGCDDWLLTPAAILEAVEDIPEIARIPRFRDSDQVIDPFVIGHPKYRILGSEQQHIVRITMELALTRSLFSDAHVALEKVVRQKLMENSKAFAVGLERKEIEFSVVFSGDIQPDLISHAD